MGRLLLLCLVVVLACVPAAQANADPASDVLYTEDLFLPYQNSIPEPLQDRLRKTIAGAKKAGFPIKVAVIATQDDLWLIYTLWRKPKLYAPFLGRELLFLYKDTLIVVMPNGFGVFRDNRAVEREDRLLASIKIGSGDVGLARASIVAVRRLAAAAGHPVGSGGGFVTLDRILLAGGGLVVLAALLLASRQMHRRRLAKLGPDQQEDDDPGEPGRQEGEERGAEA